MIQGWAVTVRGTAVWEVLLQWERLGDAGCFIKACIVNRNP